MTPRVPKTPLRLLLTAALLVAAPPARAASTGQTALHRPQGSDAATANGDYVSASVGGLNTVYRYFIEVPAGLGRLTVEIFDADVGRGGATEDTAGRDRDRNGYDSQATYTLIRPDGSTAATLANCDDNTCNDNVWTALLNSTTAQNTAAGHWELRVDMTSGDDINAIGIRAHDGTSGAGGTELNVYYDSFGSIGVNPPASGTGTASYTLYPYITAGCSAGKNDFDYDSNNGNTGSLALTSRSGSFNQNYASTSMSGDNAWRRDTFSGWTSDTDGDDYGVWTAASVINTYNNPGINGNYSVLGYNNFQAAANPPAANPATNFFRVYLPSDSGTAPPKAYLEQFVRFGGNGAAGPNPPVVGQTSIFTVTVRLTNPEPQAVTFSATNLVTANVPGGGVTYNGNPAVSQGSVTAQPAVGGTGNVTWNPGTVAAGATVLLKYQVRVTPTSAGQRLPVTATPASGNGTRARYVDNTGNTTQTRATYTFGPLCELAVTQGLLTHAVVSSFRALPAAEGGVLVEWTTASEEGTVGFRLLRRGADGRWQPVQERLIGALVGAPQGGTYRVVDGGASPRDRQVYLLEEVDLQGRRQRFGPYRVAPGEARDEAPAMAASVSRLAHAATAVVSAPRARVDAGRFGEENGDGDEKEVFRIEVDRTGLHRLTLANLVAGTGQPAGRLQAMLRNGKLALSRAGLPVAWQLESDGGGQPSGLVFYGEAADSLFTTVSVYRLELNRSGVNMAAGSVSATGGAGDRFAERLSFERDLFAGTVIAPDPASDYWFWEFLLGDDPGAGTRHFAADLPAVAGGAGTITVNLQGATATGVVDEHQVEVSLNGTPLGWATWQGIAPHTTSFAVPSGVLATGANDVQLKAHAGAGAPYSVTYLQSFQIGYERLLQALGDELTFTGSSPLTVGGFGSATVRLVDVSDPLRPRWLTGAAVTPAVGGGWSLAFTPMAGVRYVAAGDAAVRSATVKRAWKAKKIGDRSADYVLIAPPALLAGAEQLAAVRRSQGLQARVVDATAIGDNYGAGVLTPQAIRAFLAEAWTTWARRPRYVVLVGAGSLDYRDLLGAHDNLLPSQMVQTPSGLFPSDNSLGDVAGDPSLRLPEIAVGRLPVVNASQLAAYVDRLAAYEAGADEAWTAKALLLADAADGAATFADDAAAVAAQLSAGYSTQTIDLGVTPIAGARAELLSQLASGVGLVDYVGHGALDRLASGGLLTNADAAALGNGPRMPLLTAMTCTVNRFDLAGISSLGEMLITSPNGGAAAVLSASGLVQHDLSRQLAEVFHRRVTTAGAGRVGDALVASYAEAVAAGLPPGTVDLYNLLGDPALRLRAPLVPPPASPGGSTE